MDGSRSDLRGDDGKIVMLICALDYEKTEYPLSCTVDAKNMERLARVCGVQDLTTMYDEQCTKRAVLDAIGKAGRRCAANDYFIFYFAGHGTSVEDENNEEQDGFDEAMVLVDETGQVNADTFLIDDDFSNAVMEACDSAVRVVIMTDCCHSGTLCDMGGGKWRGRIAVGMSGCTDSQESGDIGKGGIFTHALLLAISKLAIAQEALGESGYSVSTLYEAVLYEDNTVFHSPQDIVLQTPIDFSSDYFEWPLVPDARYVPPLQAEEKHDMSCDIKNNYDQAAANAISSTYLDDIKYGSSRSMLPWGNKAFGLQGHCRACDGGWCLQQ